ncbi:MAG: hypothetical protein AABY15_07040 [Nanoarchaeota archaeon]
MYFISSGDIDNSAFGFGNDEPAIDRFGNIIGELGAIFPSYSYDLQSEASLQDCIDLYEENLAIAVEFPRQTLGILRDQQKFLTTIINLRKALVLAKYCGR